MHSDRRRCGGLPNSAVSERSRRWLDLNLAPGLAILLLGTALGLIGCAARCGSEGSARLHRDAIISRHGIVLTGADRLSTPGSFKPPVEISILAKTDGTNLRLAYAADQIIFNWEQDPEQLRVDGGPANGLHKTRAGSIPRGEYVEIRWLVTPTHQSIFVGDELRLEHNGDYSQIARCVSVFPAAGSVVTVRSLRVKQLSLASKGTLP